VNAFPCCGEDGTFLWRRKTYYSGTKNGLYVRPFVLARPSKVDENNSTERLISFELYSIQFSFRVRRLNEKKRTR